jgi:hypothetical protein
MDKHLEKLKEQIAIEKFINAEKTFSWDPLDFKDENNNRIDDRIDEVDEI